MLYFKVFSQANPSISKSSNQEDLPKIIAELVEQNVAPLTVMIIPKFKKGDLVRIIDPIEIHRLGHSSVVVAEFLGTTHDNFYRISDGSILYERQLQPIVK